MKRNRVGEFVCNCKAYKFPHRFSGGRCKGEFVISEYWNAHWGSGQCCKCGLNNKTDGAKECEVLNGQESVSSCNVWLDFVERKEIRVYWL